ncbi:MAG: lytic transglycosylase domain-containing protein [Sphingomonadaceae bacterium]
MRKILFAIALATLVPCASSAGSAAAQPAGLSDAGFRAYLPQLRARALGAGVDRRTVDRVFAGLDYSERAVRLMASPSIGPRGSGYPPFTGSDEQRAIAGRVAQGNAKFVSLAPWLRRIEQQTGVSPSVIIAIYGKETNYGGITGNFDALNAIASLAYEGRRRALFEEEFVAALRMIERGIPRSRLVGSFAGALGKPQFLPSVYLRLAVDGDGDGRADIWNSEPDALASIANYLKAAGWRPGVRWGFAVEVPPGLNRAALRDPLVPPRCDRVYTRHSKWLTVGEWKRLGLRPGRGWWPGDDVMATLLEPDGPGRTAYLLTTNYRAILDYNCSNFYALAVGLLADRIGR